MFLECNLTDVLYFSWLREQHSVPGAINGLFAPSLQSRIKMCIKNPLVSSESHHIPFHGRWEDSALQETTAVTLAKLNETSTSLRVYPVDMVVKNPLFGSGLTFAKVLQSRYKSIQSLFLGKMKLWAF